MSVNPTHFLYRFPGPKGPGPYTMKYWWTLGCFPTGLSVPFRLQEFLSTYQQQHVPAEVEEWLNFVIIDPVQSLRKEVNNLYCAIESYTEPDGSSQLDISAVSKHSFAPPLKKMESTLGVFISPVALTKTLKYSDLREKVLECLEEYQELLEVDGSTPHRRFARYYLDSPFDQTSIVSSDSSELVNFPQAFPEVAFGIGSFVDPPADTAPDEKKIIQLLLNIAEGSSRAGLFFDARETLYSALPFSHDATSASLLYSNIASSALALGEFREAEHYAQESLLAVPLADKRRKKKIYKVWCSAVASQGEFMRCETVIDEALQIFSDDNELELWKEQIHAQVNSKQTIFSGLAEARSRSKLAPVQARQLPLSTGKTFDNEFAWTAFKNKLYPSKMNPSSNEMGSVFRRVGDLGLHTSTSRSTEFL